MEYRINGFEQIKSFYSFVFNNQEKGITSQHVALYGFLINQNNRNNWVEWFKCPFDLGMTGSCIGNKKTYYKCLSDLQDWGLITYQKGVNNWKAPLIRIEVLNCTATGTATGTATVPQSEPLLVPQPIPLPTHIYKLITNNLKRITDNISLFENFILGLENKFESPIEKTPKEKEFDRFNEWIDKKAPYIRNIRDQITFDEYCRLTEKYNGEQIRKVLTDLANFKDAPKRYVSVNLTFQNWAKREYK